MTDNDKYWKERCNDSFLESSKKNKEKLESLKKIEDNSNLQNSLVFQKANSLTKFRMRESTQMKKLTDF